MPCWWHCHCCCPCLRHHWPHNHFTSTNSLGAWWYGPYQTSVNPHKRKVIDLQRMPSMHAQDVSIWQSHNIWSTILCTLDSLWHKVNPGYTNNCWIELTIKQKWDGSWKKAWQDKGGWQGVARAGVSVVGGIKAQHMVLVRVQASCTSSCSLLGSVCTWSPSESRPAALPVDFSG